MTRKYTRTSYVDQARKDFQRYSWSQLEKSEQHFLEWSQKELLDQKFRDRFARLAEVVQEEKERRQKVAMETNPTPSWIETLFASREEVAPSPELPPPPTPEEMIPPPDHEPEVGPKAQELAVFLSEAHLLVTDAFSEDQLRWGRQIAQDYADRLRLRYHEEVQAHVNAGLSYYEAREVRAAALLPLFQTLFAKLGTKSWGWIGWYKAHRTVDELLQFAKNHRPKAPPAPPELADATGNRVVVIGAPAEETMHNESSSATLMKERTEPVAAEEATPGPENLFAVVADLFPGVVLGGTENPRLQHTPDPSRVTLTRGGEISLSQSYWEQLGKPTYVQRAVTPDKRFLILVPCTPQSARARRVTATHGRAHATNRRQVMLKDVYEAGHMDGPPDKARVCTSELRDTPQGKILVVNLKD